LAVVVNGFQLIKDFGFISHYDMIAFRSRHRALGTQAGLVIAQGMPTNPQFHALEFLPKHKPL
jgi:hypothetical protein